MMGYAVYQDNAARHLGVERWAGYGVPAVCDQPECAAVIDRGLSYRCESCGLSFCSSHLYIGGGEPQKCAPCCDGEPPVTPKPDEAEWERHMLTDDSWAMWRDENPERVELMRERVEKAGA